MMFDAHTHLKDFRILKFLPRLLAESEKNGVTELLTCSAAQKDWQIKLPNHNKIKIHEAFGIHPWFIENLTKDWKNELKLLLIKNPNAPIGEIGIDGIRNNKNTDHQISIFKKQLELAIELNRPVILHGAKIWAKLFEILKQYANDLTKIMIHGASFPLEMMDLKILKNENVFFSIGGNITRQNSTRINELVKNIPDEQLLVETDSPDLFPTLGEPLVLGEKGFPINQPANLTVIAKKTAEIRNQSEEQIINTTRKNALKFIDMQSNS